MRSHRTMHTALAVGALLAVLAAPVEAQGPPVRGSHHPGEKCIKCHKTRGRTADPGRAQPGPEGGPATGTGAAGPQTGPAPPPAR